ncbi:MAG: hypothetical protein ACSLFR_03125 [Solirubrobacteraceae bacterium]
MGLPVAVEALPETATVPWRPRADPVRLRNAGRLWTLTTVAHVVPFLGAAVLLVALEPLALPVALACLAHAWVIPELYAQRGGNVVRPPRRPGADPAAEGTALGLLGDLLDHEERALQQQTGLALEHGAFGVWLIGQGGALLIRPGGRRALCWCVRVDGPGLPAGDHTAHLLLALRRRGGLRHRGEPVVLRRDLAGPATRPTGDAIGDRRGPSSGKARQCVPLPVLNLRQGAIVFAAPDVDDPSHVHLHRSPALRVAADGRVCPRVRGEGPPLPAGPAAHRIVAQRRHRAVCAPQALVRLTTLAGPPLPVGTLEGMSPDTRSGPSFTVRAIAVVVLLVAAWVLLKAVIGLVSALLWPVLAIVAVIAVIWAIGVLR